MIHPETKLCYVNEDKGRGIVATSFIPKGTLTYVKDPLEIEIPPDDPRLDDPRINEIIETYSYINEFGNRIISWDNAKYVNHCCDCNTMSTGYGFEIAIRDIDAGEEITDEYGMFNVEDTLELSCINPACRKNVNGSDITKFSDAWDQKVKSALQYFEDVYQPLLPFVDQATLKKVKTYLQTGKTYISVLNLQYQDGEETSKTNCI